MLNKEKKFVFVHINRTAGTSIGRNLQGNYKVNHATIFRYMEKHDLNNYFKFSFVRNPFDKMVSEYFCHMKVKDLPYIINNPNLSFKEFIIRRFKSHLRFASDQINWIGKKENGEYKLYVDFIGRYENLKDDFKKVCDKINIKYNLEHVNLVKRDNYRKYYNDETRQLVEILFEEDIRYFNYEF